MFTSWPWVVWQESARVCHFCSSGLSNRKRNWILDLLTSSVPHLHLLYLGGGGGTYALWLTDWRKKTSFMFKGTQSNAHVDPHMHKETQTQWKTCDCTHSSRGHRDPYSCKSGCTVFYCLNLIVKLSELNREKNIINTYLLLKKYYIDYFIFQHQQNH